jgi:hypothetical protein
LPLLIPVSNNTLTNIEKLSEDKYTCILTQKYQPETPHILRICHEVKILDDNDFLSISSLKEDEKLWQDLNNNDNDKYKDFASKITKIIPRKLKSGTEEYHFPVKRKLFIQIKVRLSLPVELELSELPILKRVSIEWPTLTSFQNFGLKIGDKPANIIYNPLSRRLECIRTSSNIQLKPYNESKSRKFYEIQILLEIPQPADFYDETKLKGDIEVEIPMQLLSETQARFYGFNSSNESKFGEDTGQNIQLNTHLISDFCLHLNEAFKERLRTTTKEIIFHNTLLTEENLRIIIDILESHSFSSYCTKLSNNQLNCGLITNDLTNESTWLIYAQSSKETEKITLWIAISEVEKKQSATISHGERKFQGEESTGKLKMRLLGKLTGDAYTLIQRMNTLEKEFRKYLVKVEQGPDMKK